MYMGTTGMLTIYIFDNNILYNSITKYRLLSQVWAYEKNPCLVPPNQDATPLYKKWCKITPSIDNILLAKRTKV